MKKNEVPGVIVVLCTAPPGSAHTIAGELISRSLAACVNILPIRSVYRWEGTVCDDPEELMIIKTTQDVADDLTTVLIDLHPYDLPEVICLPVTAGSADYLSWVMQEVQNLSPR